MKYTNIQTNPRPLPMNLPFVYDGVITVPVTVRQFNVNNASTPVYFTGSPVLRNKKIKGIVYYPVSSLLNTVYFTFYNGNREQIVTNLPAQSIESDFVANGSNKYPAFDLYDIDILNSYWIYVNNVGWAASSIIFYLNFYY